MGLFARSNHKAGWVRTRKPVVEMLRDLKRDLSTVPPEVSNQPSVVFAGMAVDPVAFSQQLGSLQTSLHRANASAIAPTPNSIQVTETERVRGR